MSGLEIGKTPAPQNPFTAPNKPVKPNIKDVKKSLTPDQRKWSDNVLKALKLPSEKSQSRIFAGAVSGAQVIANSNPPPAVKTRAAQLLKTVFEAGTPPWKDVKKAERATAAKVELDLISLNKPELKPLSQGQGVNSAFWITRQDADGKERASFLCKTASPKSDVAGVPPGGEVVREAVSSRAAQHLTSLAKIDIGMPESHMLDLSQLTLGGKVLKMPGSANGSTLASVQEARPSVGSLSSKPDSMKTADSTQVAKLAVFDMMTLNVDRHGGNVLLDDQGNLIPIDHGGSFPDLSDQPHDKGNNEARNRIRTAMGGRHNILLKIPSAHEPLSDEMANNLGKMASSDFGKSLKEDRDRLNALHPGQDALLPDAAILSAQRAARFVKLGARTKPRMSPAAIQSALAAAADLLAPNVSERDFETGATALLQQFADRQEVVKEVCCSSNEDYFALWHAVKKLGWDPITPGVGGDATGLSDPLVMLFIVSEGLKPQKGQSKRKPPVPPVTNQKGEEVSMPDQATLLATLAEVRRDGALEMIQYTDPNDFAMFTKAVKDVANKPAKDQLAAYSAVVEDITEAALAYQKRRLDDLYKSFDIPPGTFTLDHEISIGDAVTAYDRVETAKSLCGTQYRKK